MSSGLPTGQPLLMRELILKLAQSTTTTTAKGNTSSSSSFVPLLVIALIFGVVYFAFIRPRSQRLRQQQTRARELAIGDEVMSAGGIYGRVVALDSDAVEVEVAPGVVLTFTRRAISARPPTTPAEPAPVADEPIDEPWDRPGSGPSGLSAPERHPDDDPPGEATGGAAPTGA